MKKLLSIIAFLAIANSSQGALIHILNIKNKGPRGFKKIVDNQLGGLLSIQKCLDPGTLSCPFICACGTSLYVPTPNESLPVYQKDFILESFSQANKNLNETKNKEIVINRTYLLPDGTRKVLTAKLVKINEQDMDYTVAVNNTLAENLAEIQFELQPNVITFD
jgi:hypothetical protein